MRAAPRSWCCFRETDAQSLTSLFTASGIQHEVPRYPENPGPGIVLVRWCFRETLPYNKKRLSDHVLSIFRVRATLNKLQ
jgi:hypothetical protein